MTDNYRYNVSQGVIHCCECLRAKGWSWKVLALPASVDLVTLRKTLTS